MILLKKILSDITGNRIIFNDLLKEPRLIQVQFATEHIFKFILERRYLKKPVQVLYVLYEDGLFGKVTRGDFFIRDHFLESFQFHKERL